MNDKTQAMADRIRKLLALAGDNASEAEAASALAHAHKLMQEYDLSEADLFLDNDKAESLNVTQAEAFNMRVCIERSEYLLADAVCLLCDVKCFHRSRRAWTESGKPVTKKTIVFFGLERDVAIAKVMLAQLSLTMKAIAKSHYGAGWTKAHWNFGTGFGLRVLERVSEMRKAKTTDTGTAIVLVKHQAIAKYQATLNLKAGRSRELVISNGDAFSHGRRVGGTVHLGTDGITSRTPQKRLN